MSTHYEVGCSCESDPDWHSDWRAPTESQRLRAALEAAQDEIERRIEASENDRELIRQLGTVVEHMAPAAYRAIVGGAS
jgi:hypothetical protein